MLFHLCNYGYCQKQQIHKIINLEEKMSYKCLLSQQLFDFSIVFDVEILRFKFNLVTNSLLITPRTFSHFTCSDNFLVTIELITKARI
jgi:hypothetical protein